MATRWTALIAVAATVMALSVSACSQPSECELAMRDAARVPLAETNDAEVIETLKVCSPAEWYDALERHPEVLGVESITDRDEITTWQLACPRIPEGESALCDDMREAGALD